MLIAAGPPSRVLEEAIDGRFDLVVLEPVMVELERILIAKLGFETERWRAAEELLTELAVERIPAPQAAPDAITGDPDDDLILACAIRAGVDVLVSGDHRHLLPVGEHRGVRVLSPQGLLAELRGA